MKRYRNWIIAFAISATAGAIALQNVNAPTEADPVTTLTITEEAVSGNCAFTWAYHDAPELTEKVDSAIRALNYRASANVSLYGEDCIYADGQSTFSVMETDFYIHLPVDDLTATEAFGNWMAQVMKIIIQIPREELRGNYGFVEFWFEQNDIDHIVLRVPIQQYLDAAQDKAGVEMFQMFYSQP